MDAKVMLVIVIEITLNFYLDSMKSRRIKESTVVILIL